MDSADKLVNFLRARLDEDERIARRATARQTGGESWTHEQPALRTGSTLTVAERMVPVFGEHIARHDPARVLVEVEAKRRLLLWAQNAEAGYNLLPIIDTLAGVYRDHPDFDSAWLES
ncbi:DUF6221 family protein [Streptomyces cavernae]|uniref:DUF6221 family protein n=1 Tax=Streptomyces cavernae TaxID=2259034 RepID=UPI000FEBEECA|nr:DUF6221 family protein [Streptomyces cavernae]